VLRRAPSSRCDEQPVGASSTLSVHENQVRGVSITTYLKCDDTEVEQARHDVGIERAHLGRAVGRRDHARPDA